MTDREDFVINKMEDLDNMGLPDECVTMVRDVVEELADSAAEVDALCAQLASLTVQRDAAEALAREAKRDLDAVVDVLASQRDAAQQMVADVSAAAQGVVDAWHEPERPYVGERMDILGTTLGKAAPIAGRWCLASERDEALAILRDMCRARTLHEFDSLGIMDRARKLVGGGE
jgi:hypothetical protein